jgi:hypothetical protein
MFDMADPLVVWVELMNYRLELARKIHSAVDNQVKVAQARRSALPKQARGEPPALLPGSFALGGGRTEILPALDGPVHRPQQGTRVGTSLPDFPHRNECFV